ncbi:hypothetical protein E4T38_07478 [Aureobasidium subglaciale]|nr:hypothetical protein E4T38_07478 [Aureobasidium subglaciale]KAI5217334.1 hypothetical protein E4T40_07489 [Aureobasidium subglaciale]KAI5220946.1 hypothetical protein E4T41_07330 [Aureobasidium subglaciale]KAI5258488.1 hypothetical protein E4T46_07307 [Aureobasidium subglaciale]
MTLTTISVGEKGLHVGTQPGDPEKLEGVTEDFEVFKQTEDGVNFRTVGWPMATVIFLKTIFALGVLSIPSAMYSLGAVGGALSVIGWQALNTYTAVLQGDFRNNHPRCHSIADMAGVVGGPIMKELTGAMFIVAYVILTGSGIVGVSIGINALSHHAACSVWWAVLATFFVAAAASVRKFHQIGWLTWIGFASIFIAVFVLVIAVTTRDRPAAAPQTGDYEFGFYAIAYPTFAAGMVASCTIFVSGAGTSAMLPVISEMKNPRDYRKALFICMSIVTAAYLSFSLIVYRWCGQTIKMVCYGIALPSLVVSACLYLHVAAKYIFVRLLRDSPHLQSNTFTHWATWLSCTFSLAAISFVLAEAVPIFDYLLSLAGSICFAPLAISLPAWLWIYDHKSWRKGSVGQKVGFWLHALFIPLGIFVMIGGTYGVVVQIKEAYASGQIGSAFSCADNSNST